MNKKKKRRNETKTLIKLFRTRIYLNCQSLFRGRQFYSCAVFLCRPSSVFDSIVCGCRSTERCDEDVPNKSHLKTNVEYSQFLLRTVCAVHSHIKREICTLIDIYTINLKAVSKLYNLLARNLCKNDGQRTNQS